MLTLLIVLAVFIAVIWLATLLGVDARAAALVLVVGIVVWLLVHGGLPK